MRIHPRKEAGIVVDFVPKGSTHTERVVTLHSLLDADFYREGARVTPDRGAGSSAVPPKPDARSVARPGNAGRPPPGGVILPRVAAHRSGYLDDEEQDYWATIAGRQIRFEERAELVEEVTDGREVKGALEQFLFTCAAENPNRRLRMMALAGSCVHAGRTRDFDDLVTLVTQAPTWEKDRLAGVRMLLRAIGQGKPKPPIRSSSAGRGDSRGQPGRRRTVGERGVPRGQAVPGRARKLARTSSRGKRREARRDRAQPRKVGAALLASAEGLYARAKS